MKKRLDPGIKIIGGMLLGALVGQLLFDPNWSKSEASSHSYALWLQLFEFFGFTVFIGLLKMLVVPLVAVSVMLAISGLSDFNRLKSLAGKTLLYYFVTMALAVALGLTLVSLLAPGEGINSIGDSSYANGGILPSISDSPGTVIAAFKNLFKLIIPSNIFKAFADGAMLSIISFSMFFGTILLFMGNRASALIKPLEVTYDVLMKMVEMVIALGPYGVFCLMAWTIARMGFGALSGSLASYILTVVLGLLLHAFVILPFIYWMITGRNPYKLMFNMRKALLTALGTDSSTATLPVSIECATEEAGIKEEVSGMVLTLGSTINMDGTALYEAVAVVFMAQAYGISLDMTQLLVVGVTATLAAVGAAGIPSAGLVTMLIVLNAVNASLQGVAVIPEAAIGLIIGVDRILDMIRTSVNVWGDAVGAGLVDHIE